LLLLLPLLLLLLLLDRSAGEAVVDLEKLGTGSESTIVATTETPLHDRCADETQSGFNSTA
jgi:hypothetical protein